MKDIRHEVVETDDGFQCSQCEVSLPSEVAVISPFVLEVAGLFTPFDGSGGWVKCTSPAVEAIRRDTEAIKEHAQEILVEDAPLAPGETKKEARPVTQFDRMLNSNQWNAYQQMRNMTRPEGK